MGVLKYITVTAKNGLKESELNIYGAKGWLLNAVYHVGNRVTYIFSKECDNEKTNSQDINKLHDDGIISLRLRSALLQCGITTISDLQDQYEKVCHNFSSGTIKNCGDKTIEELSSFVKLYNII